jgi:hypothetical protein
MSVPNVVLNWYSVDSGIVNSSRKNRKEGLINPVTSNNRMGTAASTSRVPVNNATATDARNKNNTERYDSNPFIGS